MSQLPDKFSMFRNRLTKVYRHLRKQARAQGVTCYRIYDHDLPEFPFMIEIYETKLYVAEYKRNHSLSDEAHAEWLQQCKSVISETLDVPVADIFFKMRQRKENRQGQYQRTGTEKNEFIVKENNLDFIVNLSDYLDTGLFLDHRITRKMVMDLSKHKTVLNLFCYTGSFSVYAVAGGATRVVSVDLSKTYLNWAERNIALNFPEFAEHEEVHADVKQFLKNIKQKFDIIVIDPPTFSNSKRMEDFLDIQRDHVALLNDCMDCVNENGVVYFSTNFTKFRLDAQAIHAREIRDLTRPTTPFDFAGKLQRFCYKLTK